MIPVSISRLNFQKTLFQFRYQESSFKIQKGRIVVLEAITNKVLEEYSDICILYLYLYADSESDCEEEVWSDSDKDLDNDH